MTEQTFRPGGLVLPATGTTIHLPEDEKVFTQGQARDWLADHGLPSAHILVLDEDGAAADTEDDDDL